MDNDVLIDQARLLYAALCIRQLSISNEGQSRLERLLASAYCRYQRRLNRCVVCYQYRAKTCIRNPGGKNVPCSSRKSFNQVISV